MRFSVQSGWFGAGCVFVMFGVASCEKKDSPEPPTSAPTTVKPAAESPSPKTAPETPWHTASPAPSASPVPEENSPDKDEALLWKSAVALSSIADVEHNFCWVVHEDFVPSQDEFENERTKERLRARKADLLTKWFKAKLVRGKGFDIESFDFDKMAFPVELAHHEALEIKGEHCDLFLAKPNAPESVVRGDSTEAIAWLMLNKGALGRRMVYLPMADKATAEQWRHTVVPKISGEILFQVAGTLTLGGGDAYGIRGIYPTRYVIRLLNGSEPLLTVRGPE